MRSTLLTIALGILSLCRTAAGQQPGSPQDPSPSSLSVGAPLEQSEPIEAGHSAEAARLVDRATGKLQRGEADGAEKDLKAAGDLDPGQHGVFGGLGSVALLRGNRSEALVLYSKEVRVHPDSAFAWRNIIAIEASKPLVSEALAHEWIAASPGTVEPWSTLIRLLWDNKQDAAALTAAKVGAAALPGRLRESNEYQLVLGEAQMRGGEVNEGSETLSHLVQSDATLLQTNDASYALARSHRQLRVAEISMRDALRKLGSVTAAWTGDEPVATLRATTAAVVSAWETLGYVLLQEGKFDEAEPYAAAAWRNQPTPETGEHLGDVQVGLHIDREAALTYALASSLAHGSDASSAPLARKAAAAAQKVGISLPEPAAAAEQLAKQRTLPVSGAANLSGTAVYGLLFTRDGVLQAVPAAGSTPALNAAVRQAKLSLLFPPGQPMTLFHVVSLTCGSGACSVLLIP